MPELIAPVKAQGARYGKRGTFKDALMQMLQTAAPNAMSTTELSLRLRHHFDLHFATPAELKRWTDNILRKQLRRSVREGEVERLKVTEGHSDDAYWRVAQVEPAWAGSLDELRDGAATKETDVTSSICRTSS